MEGIEQQRLSPRLEIRDLRLVLELAAAGTTGRAAPALHLTQPAVSRALLGLERRLGVPIFERTPKGLRPTEAGRQVLRLAPRLLADLLDLEHCARKPFAERHRLRLVCECYTAYHWLPSVIERLRHEAPGLELVLAVEHTLEPVRALLAGEIDVALLTVAAAPRRRVEEKPLFADEVVFVVARSHPLAGRAALAPRDLLPYPLLTSHLPTPDMRWFTRRVSAPAGHRLQYQHLPLTEAVLDFARAGMGVGVLSEWLATPHLRRGDLVAKRLTSGPLRRPWRIAWRPEVREPALRLSALLEHSAPRADA